MNNRVCPRCMETNDKYGDCRCVRGEPSKPDYAFYGFLIVCCLAAGVAYLIGILII